MVSEAKKASNSRYNARHTKQITVRFVDSNERDQRILEFLKSQPNISGLIKDLIEKEMSGR